MQENLLAIWWDFSRGDETDKQKSGGEHQPFYQY